MKKLTLVVLVLAVPASGWAQVATPELERQQNLDRAHSAVQKTGLATLAIAGTLGLIQFANKPTLFGDGLCSTGEAIGGDFACGGGMSILHFVFAASTLGLFVAEQVIAAEMNPSPYRTGDLNKDRATDHLRWVNAGLFIAQPVLGLIAAHPALIGIPTDARPMFSRVMRTVHFGVGLGLATTYTVNAALMW
ncbi:MAG: hypothetical protein JNK82_24785 [Myxococcaceae bacterium]|nr:hypothetical protein [Myxococcaceae bacterium]